MNEQVLNEQMEKLTIRERVRALKNISGLEHLIATQESDNEVVFNCDRCIITIRKSGYRFQFKDPGNEIIYDYAYGFRVVDKDKDSFLLVKYEHDDEYYDEDDSVRINKAYLTQKPAVIVPHDTKMESVIEFRMDEYCQIETDNIRDMEKECDYEGNMDIFRGIDGFEDLVPKTERTYDATFLTKNCAACVSDIGFVFVIFIDGEPVATLEGNELFENDNGEVVVMRDMQTVGRISKTMINPDYKRGE